MAAAADRPPADRPPLPAAAAERQPGPGHAGHDRARAGRASSRHEVHASMIGRNSSYGSAHPALFPGWIGGFAARPDDL